MYYWGYTFWASILGFQLSLPVLYSILCPACYYRHMLFYTYVAAILDYWGHTERRENEGEERESKARGEREEREGERETHRFRRRFSGRWLGTWLSLHCRQIQQQKKHDEWKTPYNWQYGIRTLPTGPLFLSSATSEYFRILKRTTQYIHFPVPAYIHLNAYIWRRNRLFGTEKTHGG